MNVCLLTGTSNIMEWMFLRPIITVTSIWNTGETVDMYAVNKCFVTYISKITCNAHPYITNFFKFSHLRVLVHISLELFKRYNNWSDRNHRKEFTPVCKAELSKRI